MPGIHLLSVFSILLSNYPSTSSTEYKTRETKYGQIKGYIHEIKDVGKVERYLGVPYAKPPVGKLRFEDAEDPVPWHDKILNTTVLSSACHQIEGYTIYIARHYDDDINQSEDCLYLNIYLPLTNKKIRNMEVLVHIHGGSNGFGMGGMLHGDILAIKANVILITFNYRLGVFGFFGSHSPDFPGNYGMKDQTKALRWVQENIHYFGGDKNKVTITGHSAGACDVGLHIISPLSKGLFRYSIMESGSPVAFWCIERNSTFLEESFQKFAISSGCLQLNETKSKLDVKECLKSLDESKLAHIKINRPADRYFQLGVNIGDDFLPKDPGELIHRGKLHGESFMTGLTSLEGAWAFGSAGDLEKSFKRNMYFSPIPEQFDNNSIFVLKEIYASDINSDDELQRNVAVSQMIGDAVFNIPAISVADEITRRGEEIYFYRFDHISNNITTDMERMGVEHGEDLFYLFGAPFTGHFHRGYTDEDKEISEAYIQIFSSFVKTGNPSVPNYTNISIPTYTLPEKIIFCLDSDDGKPVIRLERNFREKFVKFWKMCLSYLQNGTLCFHNSGSIERVSFQSVILILSLSTVVHHIFML